jgi:predicted nucleotide-binding protein
MSQGVTRKSQPDPGTVFLVHGKNIEAKKAVEDLLGDMGLKVLTWDEASDLTGQTNPHAGTILEVGLAMAHTAVVLFTGDDVARTGRRFEKEKLTAQPRQNVLYEAGMAKALFPNRVINVQIGRLRTFSDVAGIQFVRLDDEGHQKAALGTTDKRQKLAKLLQAAGCKINTDPNGRWLSKDYFKMVRGGPDNAWKTVEVPRVAIGATGLVVIGLLALFFFWGKRTVLQAEPQISEIHVSGYIRTNEAANLYIVGLPEFVVTRQQSNPFDIHIPVIPRNSYVAYLVARGEIVHETPFEVKGSDVNLGLLDVDFHKPARIITKGDILSYDQAEDYLKFGH